MGKKGGRQLEKIYVLPVVISGTKYFKGYLSSYALKQRRPHYVDMLTDPKKPVQDVGEPFEIEMDL